MKLDSYTTVLVPDAYRSKIIKRPVGLSKRELNDLIKKKINEFNFNEVFTITYLGDAELQIIELNFRRSIDLKQNANLTPIFSIAKKIAHQYRDCVCIVYISAYSCVVTIKNGFVTQYSKVDENTYEAETYIKRLIKFNMSNNEKSIILSDIMIESLDIEKFNLNDELVFISDKYEKLQSFNRIYQLTTALKRQFDLSLFSFVITIALAILAYITFNINNEIEVKSNKFEMLLNDKMKGQSIAFESRLDEMVKLTNLEVSKIQDSIENLNHKLKIIDLEDKKNSENLRMLNSKYDEVLLEFDNLKNKEKPSFIKEAREDIKLELKMIIDDAAIIKVFNKSERKLIKLYVGQTIELNKYLTLKLVSFDSVVIDDKRKNKVYNVVI